MKRVLSYKTARGEMVRVSLSEFDCGFHVKLMLYCEQMNELVVADIVLVTDLANAKGIYGQMQQKAQAHAAMFGEYFVAHTR